MKEQNEFLISGESFKSSVGRDALLDKAVWAANIRTLRMLINFPDVIKEAEKQVEQVKKQRAKMSKSQEQGTI